MEMQKPNLENEKPFVLFKTKQELVEAKAKKQLDFSPEIETKLNKFELGEVLGVKVMVNSPSMVVDVEAVTDPNVFLELAF